jgi:hypothetical protein
MNSFIIFDKGGSTADRFTIINTETGDVFAASDNPDTPNGGGKFIGNCADHRIVLYGAGWRQKLPTKKMIRDEIENYINNARLDADWLGREVDFLRLPESVRRYTSQILAHNSIEDHKAPSIVYMSGSRSDGIPLSGMK